MPDSRLDDFGLPQDYAKEDLRYLMVEEEGYLSEDFDRVVEKFHKSRGLLNLLILWFNLNCMNFSS